MSLFRNGYGRASPIARDDFRENELAVALGICVSGGAALALTALFFQDQPDYSKYKTCQKDKTHDKDRSKNKDCKKHEDQKAYEAGYQNGLGV